MKSGISVLPLQIVASSGHREMVLYLYGETKLEQLHDYTLGNIFHDIVAAEIYDVALDMLENNKKLAFSRDASRNTVLHLLARKPSAIANESHLGFFKGMINSGCKSIFHNALMRASARRLIEEIWKEVTKFSYNDISDFIRAPSRLLFDAAACGNTEFLLILLRSCPELIWEVDSHNRSLFHVAAINRQESTFSIIYELGAFKDYMVRGSEENTKNTMLHLVANFPHFERLQVASGPAFQMQMELKWFEAVKRTMPISLIEKENVDGDTAHEIFGKQHEDLQIAGEKWMKETAQSCMIVATLVATVVFAAAFTIPGGNNQDTGIPILKTKIWFTIFVVTDAIALSTSSGSIVLFLSFLTSRYTQSDFRRSLPLKLMFGLLALAISILAMVMTFSASFFLVYNQKAYWIPILSISLVVVPTALYLALHRRLLIDTVTSTIWSSDLSNPRKRRLYPRKHPLRLSKVLHFIFRY